MTIDKRLCEQGCGKIATHYAGGSFANDWAGCYCHACIPSGFSVWEHRPNGFDVPSLRNVVGS